MFLRFFFLFIILFLTLSSCKKEKKAEDIEDVKTETTYNSTLEVDAPCLSEADWFPHSQTPAPEEGKGSPFEQ